MPNTPKIPWLSASGIARVILALVSFYILIALLGAAYFNPTQGRPLHVYFQLVMVVCCGFGFFSLWEISWKPANIKAGLLLFALGALSWFLYRQEFLLKHSLWFDETTQFLANWTKAPQDETLYAAWQQQPPLDYTLSAFARHIYGLSEVSVVIHAVIFGILSQIVLLLWIRLTQLPLLLAPLPLLLFAAQGTLLKYSSEARPISLATFFSSLALFFLYERLKKKSSPLPLFASALFLFYSNGLQPHFFLFFMTLAFLPWSLLQGSKKEVGITFSAFFLLPSLIFLPTLYEIYVECVNFKQFHGTNHFQYWWLGLMNIRWRELQPYWESFQPAQGLLFLPLATLTMSFKNRSKEWRRLSIGTLIFIFLYPFAFQVFWTTINWGLSPHYFSTWISGCIFLLALHLALLSQAFTNTTNKWILIPALATTLFYLHFYFVPLQQEQPNMKARINPNWRLLAALGKKIDGPSYYLQIPFDFLTSAKEHDSVGDLYPPTKNLKLRLSYSYGRYRLRPEFRQLHGALVCYLKMQEKVRPKILPALRPLAQEIVEMNEDFVAFTVKNEKSVQENIETIYQKILTAYPEQPENFLLLAGLLELAQKENKPTKKILEKLRALQEKEPEVKIYLENLTPKPAATAQ